MGAAYLWGLQRPRRLGTFMEGMGGPFVGRRFPKPPHLDLYPAAPGAFQAIGEFPAWEARAAPPDQGGERERA